VEAEWLDASSSGIAQRRTMSARRFPALVGIDGGGSRTRAVLVCGKRRVQVEGGTVRIGAVGIGEACERIVNLLAEIKLKGELPGFDAVVAGIAGVWLPEERQRVGQVLRWMARERGLVIEQLLVTSDAEIAIEGAFGGAPGVVLIAGTGTIAIGKTARGELVRCGGWGIELDDEGSGAWIGREGLTAVVRALDGRGRPTQLTERLAALYPEIRPDQPRTIVAAYNERLFDYPTLTPLVMACAAAGDEVCREILVRAAHHLAELLRALLRHFPTRPVPLVLMGGMLENHTPLAELFRRELQRLPEYALQPAQGTALEGALRMARQQYRQALRQQSS
jgi:glucosamine kinase